MEKYDQQVMKFKITNDKLKMEISLKDLVWLFQNSPNNTYDGEEIGVTVRRGKRKEFAKFIVDNLMDESNNAMVDGDCVWGTAFEEVFLRIIEGYEDFCKYSHDDENE